MTCALSRMMETFRCLKSLSQTLNTTQTPVCYPNRAEDSMPFCPVQAMLDYCKLRGTQAGPLFCHSDTSPIKVGQLNTELHRCLSFCGLDTSRCKGHGFRMGAACHAAEKEFSDAQIRTLGRWKSDAFISFTLGPTPYTLIGLI